MIGGSGSSRQFLQRLGNFLIKLLVNCVIKLISLRKFGRNFCGDKKEIVGFSKMT
jgi:hypothetical protein